MSTEPDFLPYGRQLIEADDIDAVVEVLRSDYLTTGPTIGRFETALAEAVEAEWAVAVTSGTAALHAACDAVGIEVGDEVIVPAISFVASANCVRYLGGEPVFVDVDPDTGLIDVEDVKAKLSPRTKAIVPVHMTGAVADVDALSALGRPIIQDAAHALGAKVPCTGLATWSFHPVKHVCTGEGGAITGVDPAQERRLRAFRNHGLVRDPEHLRHPSPGPWYYEQQFLGHNLRMTDLSAALGVSQLAKLGRFVDRRRALAARYGQLLQDVPQVQTVASSAYHLYVVQIDFEALGRGRAELMAYLRDRGIGTQVHYIPIPMQPYYQDRDADAASFPGALRWYQRSLSLPLFPAMDDSDVDRVVDHLMRWLEN